MYSTQSTICICGSVGVFLMALSYIEQFEGVERPVEDPGLAGVEGYVASGEGEYVRGVEGAGEEGRVFVA